MKRRIAIVASHPVQYHAHWYRELARSAELDIEVLYCHQPTPEDQAQAGFGVDFTWDIPLLEGYRYRFLRNVSRKPGVGEFDGSDAPELRGIIIHERFDAVVVSGWHTKSYWQAIRACWASGTPVMVRSDSHLHDERSALKRILKWLPYRYCITRFDACLAAGTWSREYFLHYGARADRIFIVPHCVAPVLASSRADSEPRYRRELRQRWGIGEKACAFLFAGKFIERKRPFDFIRAVADASAAGSEVHGLLAGDGPLRGDMETLAARLHAPVTFAGFLNQTAIPDAYKAADVLVLPSVQDTWGLVVNEAMAHARACIVSDRVGCVPDLIDPGVTGFAFPPGNVEALTGCVRLIADTPGMALRMGAEAQKLIAMHSPQVAVAGLKSAIAAIMGDG